MVGYEVAVLGTGVVLVGTGVVLLSRLGVGIELRNPGAKEYNSFANEHSFAEDVRVMD
jgi:hypothetical protein